MPLQQNLCYSIGKPAVVQRKTVVNLRLSMFSVGQLPLLLANINFHAQCLYYILYIYILYTIYIYIYTYIYIYSFFLLNTLLQQK